MSDTSTRSGMLWEVERILTECKELGTLPQILLMENVPQVHGVDNLENFNKWKLRLEELGYKNYFQDLIATDYGIPQTRNRCFMISILGDYSYTFPKPIQLKLKLKDMLEDNVNEKYYLSDKQINDIYRWNSYEKPLETVEKEISKTLTTRVGAYCAGMQLVKDTPNMKTNLCNDLIKKGKVKENDVIRHSYTAARAKDYEKGKDTRNNIMPTLDTRCDCFGVVVTENYIQWKQKGHLDIDCRAYYEEKVAPTTTTTPKSKILQNDLRIRKLTPKECGRLMNVKDEDIDKILSNQSDSSAYHLFGDSICTNVLMAIFGELLDIEWEKYLWKI